MGILHIIYTQIMYIVTHLHSYNLLLIFMYKVMLSCSYIEFPMLFETKPIKLLLKTKFNDMKSNSLMKYWEFKIEQLEIKKKNC